MLNQFDISEKSRAWIAPLVSFTAAISSGIETGNSKIGSITSRILVLDATAPNSVPIPAKPIVPNMIYGIIGHQGSATLFRSAKSGNVTASITLIKSRLLIALPRKIAPRSTGERSKPSMLPLSFSAANERPNPNMPLNVNATHSTPEPSTVMSTPCSSKAKLKITSTNSEKTIMALKLSLVRSSAAMSFWTMARTWRTNFNSYSPARARRFP